MTSLSVGVSKNIPMCMEYCCIKFRPGAALAKLWLVGPASLWGQEGCLSTVTVTVSHPKGALRYGAEVIGLFDAVVSHNSSCKWLHLIT